MQSLTVCVSLSCNRRASCKLKLRASRQYCLSAGRMLEDECLSPNEFETFRQAYSEVAAFMEYYNERRTHSAIHYMTPNEFHRAYDSWHVPAKQARWSSYRKELPAAAPCTCSWSAC